MCSSLPALFKGVDTHVLSVTCLGEEHDTVSARERSSLGTALSLPSPDRFSASSQGWEACAVVSSTPIEAQTLQLSDSEELDVVSVNARDTEDSPPQSRAYEELVEVVTRAVDLPEGCSF